MTPGLKNMPVIKKTWSRPQVKIISVKKDTFSGTASGKETPTFLLSRRL